MSAGEKRQLIWLAEVPFGGNPHRQPVLAELLSDQFDVLFVEPPPPLRTPTLSIRTQKRLRVAQAVPLLNARPALVRWLLRSRRMRRVAASLLAAQVRRHARAVGWDRRTGVVVCSNVYFLSAIESLRPATVVVDMCDDPRFYPGEPPWTEELLLGSLQRADVVTTSSRALQTTLAQLGGRQVEYVPNGVPSWFLKNRKFSPRSASGVIGFLGHIGAWVDLDLLDAVAEALPSRTLEVAGTVDASMSPALARLRRRQNVRYVGAVAYDHVPDVLARFNVGLIPFRLSKYTSAVNPIKLYEYAALNLPIVSSAFSADVCQFADTIDVCDSKEAFVAAVSERINGVGVRDTRWLAESHTWEAIARDFQNLIR